MLFALANMLIAGVAKMAGNWADIILGPTANTVTGSNAAVSLGASGSIVFGFNSFTTPGGNGSITVYLNGVSQGTAYTWAAGTLNDDGAVITVAPTDTVHFAVAWTYGPGGTTAGTFIVYNSVTAEVIDTFLVDLTTT